MGHLIFVVLHLGAVLFAPVLLVVTLPLHLIYGAISGRKTSGEEVSQRTHVRCPACRELVRRDAAVCKHCAAKLTRQPPLKWWQ